MKRIIIVFIACILSLYGSLYCFANEPSKTADLMGDLPLAIKYETADNVRAISTYTSQVQGMLAEQILHLDKLNALYYLGENRGGFSGSSLQRCLQQQFPFEEKAALFQSEVYKGYFAARTAKVLKEYSSSEAFDYAAFARNGRKEFDTYIKTAAVNPKVKERLIAELQAKLADKLTEVEPSKRKAVLEEIFALRLPVNYGRCMDYTYQLFESRVRLQLYSQLLEINRGKLEKLTSNIGMVISYEKNGQLLLQDKDSQSNKKAVHILNAADNGDGFKGLTTLQELIDKRGWVLSFTQESGPTSEFELDKAIEQIYIDDKGFVNLELGKLMDAAQNSESKPAAPSNIQPAASRLKSLELSYSSRTKAAQQLMRELNRYSIYLELKNQNISNYYTRNFEANLSTWKRSLTANLNSFGPAGMADFVTYVKQFELLDRKADKTESERKLIARFRNTDLQFRQTGEGSTWVVDLLYRINQIK